MAFIGSVKFGLAGRLVRPAVVAAAVAAVAMAARTAPAAPQGAQVVRGDVKFSQTGKNTVIEAGRNSIINYSSFDILQDEAVRFIQPGATSRVLNRIKSNSPTHIDGSLRANGIVYFVNPAGIMFGRGAIINVGGIYAGAANLSNRDFLNRVNHFSDARGAVTNYGAIYADAAYLIGRRVANHGIIVGNKGGVMLLAGEDVYIGERGGRMMVRLDG
ncbi:unnamed protein product, partial [marine sediment metagenome]